MGGGALDWNSKLQTVVAQLTTEAELIAWLRKLLTEFRNDLSEKPSTLYMDNNCAIAVAKNSGLFGRV